MSGGKWFVCIAVACWARLAEAGDGRACATYDRAEAIAVRALGVARPVAITQCVTALADNAPVWVLAATGDELHVAMVGFDGTLLADLALDSSFVVSAIQPVDLDGDGSDELAVEIRQGGVSSRTILHVLRRDHAKLVELVTAPIAFQVPGATCAGTWTVRKNAIIVLGDSGTGSQAAKLCPTDATEYRLAGGKAVKTPANADGMAMSWMLHFRDEMCGCRETACAQHVSDDMARWTQRLSKAYRGRAPKLSDADTREATQIGEAMGKCMQVAMNVTQRVPGGTAEALAKMADFKDEMCACKDTACAQRVSDEISRWSQDQAKSSSAPPKMTDEEARQATGIGEAMGKCMQRAMAPGSP